MVSLCSKLCLWKLIVLLLASSSTIQSFTPRAPNDTTRMTKNGQFRPHKKFQSTKESTPQSDTVPLYRSEGIFSVLKPLDWTSSDVVSFVRKLLERDARDRGANPARVGSRRNKSRILRVGHGGTLDPLATGVLVIGVGKGTKELQSYLSGSKKYSARGELGFETTTLDMDPTGNVTQRMAFDHITKESLEQIFPKFTGTIQQVPPLFSAIKKGGKRLYEQARDGGTSEQDIEIEARQVTIHAIKLLKMEGANFYLDIECGGGTYIRSLIRDIARELHTVATMTALERTKQGQFTLENSLAREHWSPENFYAAIDNFNTERLKANEKE